MNKYILSICALLTLIFISCSDKWDEYYHGSNKLSEEILDEDFEGVF